MGGEYKLGDFRPVDVALFNKIYKDVGNAINANGGMTPEALQVLCDLLAVHIYRNGKKGGQDAAVKTRQILINNMDGALLKKLSEDVAE